MEYYLAIKKEWILPFAKKKILGSMFVVAIVASGHGK